MPHLNINQKTKKLIKFLRPIIILSMRSWWFVARPKTGGVKAVIVCESEILLLKTTYGYNYTLPGGGVRRNEKLEDAIRREVVEEVGIIVDKITPLPPFTSTYEYKLDTVYGFYSEVKSKEYYLNDLEIDKAEWHNLNNLPRTGPVTARIIDLFKNATIKKRKQF